MLLFIFLFGLALGAVSPSDELEMRLQRGSCPMFWYSFNSRCYKYVASRMTWGEAELHCVSEGANLVSIHSQEEHDFVNSLIKNFDPTREFTWIGLTDVYKEGGWIWTDGSRVNFTLWSPGQPNNVNGREHCGHTNMYKNFMWNDEVCSVGRTFVCASHTICP